MRPVPLLDHFAASQRSGVHTESPRCHSQVKGLATEKKVTKEVRNRRKQRKIKKKKKKKFFNINNTISTSLLSFSSSSFLQKPMDMGKPVMGQGSTELSSVVGIVGPVHNKVSERK